MEKSRGNFVLETISLLGNVKVEKMEGRKVRVVLRCFFLRPAFINLFTGSAQREKRLSRSRIEFLLPRGGRILL